MIPPSSPSSPALPRVRWDDGRDLRELGILASPSARRPYRKAPSRIRFAQRRHTPDAHIYRVSLRCHVLETAVDE